MKLKKILPIIALTLLSVTGCLHRGFENGLETKKNNFCDVYIPDEPITENQVINEVKYACYCLGLNEYEIAGDVFYCKDGFK